jgi:hypothetical protein
MTFSAAAAVIYLYFRIVNDDYLRLVPHDPVRPRRGACHMLLLLLELLLMNLVLLKISRRRREAVAHVVIHVGVK